MIVSFGNPGTEDLFDQVDTKAARKTLPRELWEVARRKLGYLNAAKVIRDLRVPPGNHLEALRGDRDGQYSIRINDQYRLCFRWVEGNAHEVEIVDYH
jgi:proteic killer suppression protein